MWQIPEFLENQPQNLRSLVRQVRQDLRLQKSSSELSLLIIDDFGAERRPKKLLGIQHDATYLSVWSVAGQPHSAPMVSTYIAEAPD